ncbi:MAG: antibiotic biosynthesis monooxygenase [Comamonadaceae bacterium]|nr:MAG: antibiotic biosynthesis monooxygenase [Comamonadaceae bacterium]
MYSSTFTFSPGTYDAQFHALDAEIARIAQSITGYLGEETWENPATGLVSNVYYWESMQALEALMRHPAHAAAKERQARWLGGYQVVIAQVIGTYGDGRITHPLAGRVAMRAADADAGAGPAQA